YKPFILTLIMLVLGIVLYFPYISLQVLEKNTLLLKIIAVPMVSIIPMIMMLALPICFDLGVGVWKAIKLSASIFYRYLGRLIPLLLVMALAVLVPNIMTLAFFLEKVVYPDSLQNIRYFYLLNAITALVGTLIRLWVYTYIFAFWDSIRQKWSPPL
ncbi:MAG: hypothetical protein MI740_07205, partial [Halanaerobiales bacterium]|nr:hypothetical protein [Halanaerobiales bacterium]